MEHGQTPAPADRIVLALNSGSSSLKFGLYRVGAAGAVALVSGEAESIGEPAGRFRALRSDDAPAVDEPAPIPDQGAAVARIGQLLATTPLPAPDIIGHRIVHGGPALSRHCPIDPEVLSALGAAAAFAPLHTPAALQVIRFAQTHFPGAPEAACFDTAFHADMPQIARTLPIPRSLAATGVRRYGFHGLSCESIVRQLEGGPPGRLIIAHLGAGASITAVADGRSIDTSMGLTPTGGVIMGTRSGDLDPGVLGYLMRARGYDAGMIETLIDRASGLLGISGVSGDMRTLKAAAATEPAAALAVDMFRASVAKQLAAMTTVLGGADLIVFTGGIGENDAAGRAAICARLAWSGIHLDAARNATATNPISASSSRCAVRVLPSREDAEIALHAWRLFPQAQRPA